MNRRGVALLLVLLAMLVTAAMTAGVLAATSAQTRASGDAQTAQRVAEAAERGHILAVNSWPPESSLTTPVGATIGPIHANYSDSTASSVWITRVTDGNFWVTALARHASSQNIPPIQRRVGVLYGLGVPDVRLKAAVTIRDSLRVGGSAFVDGSDTPPPSSMPACSTSTAIAAVAAPDSTRVSAAAGALSGSPAIVQDSAAALDVQLGHFGQLTWSALVAHATYVLPNGQVVTPTPRLTPGASCDSLAPHNWGDPSRSTPCRNRFVIVHALGDVVVDSGSGQGILLAEGDVELRGGAVFAGLILARDDILALTGANRISGALVAADGRRGTGDITVIADAAAVTYSSCSVEMALRATAHLRRVSQRGWIALH